VEKPKSAQKAAMGGKERVGKPFTCLLEKGRSNPAAKRWKKGWHESIKKKKLRGGKRKKTGVNQDCWKRKSKRERRTIQACRETDLSKTRV